jgi:hypothetical protein
MKDFSYLASKTFVYKYNKKDTITILKKWKEEGMITNQFTLVTNGIKLLTDVEILYGCLSESGDIDGLNWLFKNYGIPSEFGKSWSLSRACHSNNYEIFLWIIERINIFKYVNSFDIFQWGDIRVLEWWKSTGLKDNDKCMNIFSLTGNIEALNWAVYNDCINYSEYAIEWASEEGHVKVLQWWKDSSLEFKYNELLPNYTPQEAIDWWFDSGFSFSMPIILNREPFNAAKIMEELRILKEKSEILKKQDTDIIKLRGNIIMKDTNIIEL